MRLEGNAVARVPLLIRFFAEDSACQREQSLGSGVFLISNLIVNRLIREGTQLLPRVPAPSSLFPNGVPAENLQW